MKKYKGFTLIELLIVIGIIAILAAIIYVVVDPARRLSEARNAERWSSTNAILNGILKYTVDNKGVLPTALTNEFTGTYKLGTGTLDCDDCTYGLAGVATTTPVACIDLSSDLVPTYLSKIPEDPLTPDAADTDYFVYRSASGRITVGSCNEEDIAGERPAITVSR
ncbi:MAG: hypothetical protein CMI53_00860 [Parcubacteria group bacterium]|jgi:prepilin-type N-terminal cleavage/methylation domain-containing protein|nr:hypothetical protein [Parcubacteria group bacterium]|tara:strand:- start:1723 stop:2220 length:498 start_codon:yes stop_codon:yes gene_type:complete